MTERWTICGDTALTWRRSALFLATLFLVASESPSWGWAVLVTLPVVCVWAAVHFFPESALRQWLAQGLLLVADVLVVVLATLGVVTPRAGLLATRVISKG